MIKGILIFSMSNRWIVVMLSIALMGIGAYSFEQLKIEAYPDIADTNVIVITKFNGRAAEEVEQQVTIPIERVLNNVPHVTDRRSRTIFGLSVVQLNFDENVTDYFARQQVFERLPAADLPGGVQPSIAPLTTAVGEIYRYVVEGPPEISPMQLRDLQDWVIIPRLLQVPGIADVTTFGGPIKQFHILTDPLKLRKYQLTLQQVMDAVSQNNQNTGGNIIEQGGQGFAVRGLGAIKTTEGIVLLRRGENPSEALVLLKEKIKELESHELPKGVKLRVLYDRSFLIEHSLDTVAETVFMGVSIVIILLVLVLGSFRAAFVVAATIPFAMLFAFLMMKLTGIPANLLSLGAIDFGVIVDGACVMAEHLMRRYVNATHEEKEEGIIKITLLSAQEVGREIFFSVVIIMLAYMPILLMQRVEGKLFSPMALTLAFAVLGSMICALTLIPVLISFAFSKAIRSDKLMQGKARHLLMDLITAGYAKFLHVILKAPKAVTIVGFSIVLFLISLGANLGTEFLPELDEGSIFMRSFMPSGITIKENAKIAPRIREIVAGNFPVEFVITQTGRNDDGTDPFPTDRTEILIGLKDYSLWADSVKKKELVQRIQVELQNEFPGSFFSSGQPIIDQVMEIVTGSAADLAISIVGYDFNLMRQKADSIAAIVRSTRGATAVNIEQEGTQAQLAIRIDRKSAARYGINVSDIQNMVEAAIGGKPIGTIYDGAKKYDILVRYLPESRSSIEQIRNMQVSASNGALIPMDQLAKIEYVEGQTNIYRLNGRRMVTVRTNIRGRDQGGFVAEVSKQVEQKIKIPEGYEVLYGGQYENLERAGAQLTISIPLTIIVVFIFLWMLFKELRSTLLTLMCILFALGGGILALEMRGYNFNVSAGVGFVSIFGISVMAGVLLISALNREVALTRENLKDVVHRVSAEQLKAILAIMIVAIVGLFPAAFSSGIGSDVQRPLATVIIGGLTSTLIFVPTLMPPLYWLLIRKREQH
jgi:cobalt-zinc-cadmium resistance protein CzcA